MKSIPKDKPRANSRKFIRSTYPELFSNSILIRTSRKYEKREKTIFKDNWWFTLNSNKLDLYEYVVLAGALDYRNDEFELIKIDVEYFKQNSDFFDVNAKGEMLNLYIRWEDFKDYRNPNNISFEKFVLERRSF